MNIPDAVRFYNLHRWRPRKEVAALLVIDMQNYFRETAKEIIVPLAAFTNHCRENGIPVIYTAHGHKDAERDGGLLKEWWHDLIIIGTPEHAIIDEIAPHEGDPVIYKNRYSAFYETVLGEELRNLGIRDLIIAGVMTNLCCETTARDAFVRDFRVFFLADGTATVSPDLHLASLKNLAFGFATITTIKELEGQLEFGMKE